ncbi:MAG: glycosyltransferase [Gallionella sp.]|nr:glycosyltransferase [Gallionella sp.]
MLSKQVSFVLISYNQKKFICEAVNSAFSQDYPSLEIIISDDCSTDGTYEILKDIVSNYKGNHRVILRQTDRNLGVLPHVIDAANCANGELIVLAAGDDISKPERTRKLAIAWQATAAWGLYSRYDQIDENNVILGVAERPECLLRTDHRIRQYFFSQDGVVDIVHGATSAYDKRVFLVMKDFCVDNILSEDGALSLVINLLKEKIEFVDDSLVFYRSHQGAISNGRNVQTNFTIANIEDGVLKSARYALSNMCRAQFILNFESAMQNRMMRSLNNIEIYSDIELFEMASKWIHSTFRERLVFLFTCRNKYYFNWTLQRLLGYRFFVMSKYLIRKVQQFIKNKHCNIQFLH